MLSYRLRLLYQVSFLLHVGRPEFCDNTPTSHIDRTRNYIIFSPAPPRFKIYRTNIKSDPKLLTFNVPCIVSIFQYISNKMQRYTVLLYLETALISVLWSSVFLDIILDFIWFCNPIVRSISHCQSCVHFY